MKRQIKILIVMLTLCLGGFSLNAQEEKDPYHHIGVVNVIDFNTLVLADGREVNLIGVENPLRLEGMRMIRYLKRKRMTPKILNEMGMECDKFTKNLVFNKNVRLEFDQKKTSQDGRLQAYVWYEILPNSHLKDIDYPSYYVTALKENESGHLGTFVFLNATILRAGYGTPVVTDGNEKYKDLFVDSYLKAKEVGIALFY